MKCARVSGDPHANLDKEGEGGVEVKKKFIPIQAGWDVEPLTDRNKNPVWTPVAGSARTVLLPPFLSAVPNGRRAKVQIALRVCVCVCVFGACQEDSILV